MQANATVIKEASSSTEASSDSVTPNDINDINDKTHSRQFRKVYDGRKQRVRGLWQSTASGNYYAQIQIEDEGTGDLKVRRVLLLDKDRQPIGTVAQAVTAMARLKDQRAGGELPVLSRTPRFSDFVKDYLTWIKAGDGQKALGTIEKEEGQLDGWKEHLGNRRLDQIRPSHIHTYVQNRLKAGISPRTTDLDVIALRNVLNYAIDLKWIKALPLPRARRNKSKRGRKVAKRELIELDDFEALCNAALAKQENGEPVTKNGQQLVDYLHLMAYSGTRRNEALGIMWSDVDFESSILNVRRQVTSRGVEACKNSEERRVDFNPKLEELLRDMHSRRAPDTDWVFPSPQRGEKDIPAKSFRESLELARAYALKDHPKLAGKGFHDLRHYFISYCVMSGINYMAIADWVGHQDGGVLIGKVYGHLADSHKKAMAQRVNFGPTIMTANQEAI